MDINGIHTIPMTDYYIYNNVLALKLKCNKITINAIKWLGMATKKNTQRIKRCNWFRVKNTHAAHNVIQKPFHHQQLSECFLLSQTAIIKCLLNVFTVKRCDRGVRVTQQIAQASRIPSYSKVCWFSSIALFSGPYNQNQCLYRPPLPLTAIVGYGRQRMTKMRGHSDWWINT